MTVSKSVGFRGPYVGETFQTHDRILLGRDGYIDGAAITDGGATIDVGEYKFVQAGIVVHDSDGQASIATPASGAGDEPWFLLASAVDDDPAVAPALSVVQSVQSATTGVVLAYKTNGEWKNPLSITVDMARVESAAEPGIEGEFRAYPGLTGSGPATITDVHLRRGKVVDPDGVRRGIDNRTDEENKAVSTAGFAQTQETMGTRALGRADHMVLRQREDFSSEIVHVIGGARGHNDATIQEFNVASPTMDGAAVAQAVYGKRGDRSIYRAWGNAGNLRIKGEVHDTSAPSYNAYAAQTLLAGGGTIGAVSVPGVNVAGSIVIVYVDNTNLLRMVSHSTATPTPAIVDAATTLDTATSAFTNVWAVLDPTQADIIHIVVQHDVGGGAPNQKVKYYKVDITAGATFGTVATSYTFLGSSNDTNPSIGIDRLGHCHIAYTAGTSSNAFGDLKYATIDPQGDLDVSDSYSVAGGNADPLGASGLAVIAYDNLRKPKVVVTPHDEVFIFSVGAPTASGNPTEVMVSAPGFTSRFSGVNAVQLTNVFTSFHTADLIELGAIVGETGEFFIAASSSSGVMFARLDTDPVGDGIVGNAYLEEPAALAGVLAIAVAVTNLRVWDNGLGGAILSHTITTTSYEARCGRYFTGRRFTPHAKDVYLSSFVAQDDPVASAAAVTPDEHTYREQVYRPKGRRSTIIVGDGGDYAGPDAFAHAVAEANRSGATVEVHGGEYICSGPVTILSNTHIRGIGNPRIVFPSQATSGDPDRGWLRIGVPLDGEAATSTDPSIVIITAAAGYTRYLKSGDIFVDSAGNEHEVREILDGQRFSVNYTAAGITNGTGTFHARNIEISGLTFQFDDEPDRYIHANRLRNCTFRNLVALDIRTGVEAWLTATDCRYCTFDELTFPAVPTNVFPALRFEGTSNEYNKVIGGSYNDTAVGGHIAVVAGDHCSFIGLRGGSTTGNQFTFTAGDHHVVDPADGYAALDAAANSGTRVDALFENGMTSKVHLGASEGTQDLELRGGNLAGARYESILHQLNQESGVRERSMVSGVMSGLEPTAAGAFPLIDIAAGTLVVSDGTTPGLLKEVGALSDNPGTSAGTWYFYTVGYDGALHQASPIVVGLGDSNHDSVDEVLVLAAKTNAGNTDWDRFVDMRRMLSYSSFKGSITVSTPHTGTGVGDPHYGQFNNLQAAIIWAIHASPASVPEIIIRDRVVVADADLPLEIDFYNGFGMSPASEYSLTIRGCGPSAGISIDEDSTLFSVVGNSSANVASYLRLHNLEIENDYAGAPSAGTAVVALTTGYFTEVVIDNCRTVRQADRGFDEFLDVNTAATVTRLVVADNDVTQVYGNAIDISGTMDMVQIHGNKLVHSGDAHSGIGINVDGDYNGLWISDNYISGGFDTGVAFEELGTDVAGAWIVNNRIQGTANGGTGIHATATVSAAEVASGAAIVGNIIYDGWVTAINLPAMGAFATNHRRIIGNSILDVDRAIVSKGYTIIADNMLRDISGATTNYAIEIGDSCIVVNNQIMSADSAVAVIHCDGNFINISGNMITGASIGGVYGGGGYISIVGNNITLTGAVGAGIFLDSGANQVGLIISSNRIYVEQLGIYIDDSTGTVISGNRVVASRSDYGSSAVHALSLVSCDMFVVTGNYWQWEESAPVGGNASVVLFDVNSDSGVFTGNLVKSRTGTNYDASTDPGGASCLYVHGANIAISGNYFRNQGLPDVEVATVRLAATCNNSTFVGNVVKNSAGNYMDDQGSNIAYGAGGASYAGANRSSV